MNRALPGWLVLASRCRLADAAMAALPIDTLVDMLARASVEGGFDWRNGKAMRAGRDDRGN